MIPLSLLKKGEKVKILEIQGGRGLLQKTLDLGLILNSVWEVVNNTGIGPIILKKDELKIGIGYGMAKRIFVQIISEGDDIRK